MFFVVKILPIQPLKIKIWISNPEYKLKNKYHLYHFCDMSLITGCAIFCSVRCHVVCTCTLFGDTICLLTNRKMIKIVTLIDLHIVLTYDCWHCFLVFSFWASQSFGNDNKLSLPNPILVPRALLTRGATKGSGQIHIKLASDWLQRKLLF
jgi:hypothetical protein